MSENLFDTLKQEILDTLPADQADWIVQQLFSRKVNLLFVGATGVGKSSTINALFDTAVAKEGHSPDPETNTISRYELSENLTLWDSPGFGDDPQKDSHYAEQIAALLRKKDSDGNLLIDAAVVILDGASRDLGTAYRVVEKVLYPVLGNSNRIILALNRCDLAMGGRGWDEEKRQPTAPLQNRLEQQASSVQERFRTSVGLNVRPVIYSAYYHYNLSRLLVNVLEGIPEEKRYLVTDELHSDPDIWKSSDGEQNYGEAVQNTIRHSIGRALLGAAQGAEAGAAIGSFIPVIGSAVGATIGAVLGFLGSL